MRVIDKRFVDIAGRITAWHINADEPTVLDYRDEPGKPKEYFATDAYRSSDHDPLIIGLDIGAQVGLTTSVDALNVEAVRGGGSKCSRLRSRRCGRFAS